MPLELCSSHLLSAGGVPPHFSTTLPRRHDVLSNVQSQGLPAWGSYAFERAPRCTWCDQKDLNRRHCN